MKLALNCLIPILIGLCRCQDIILPNNPTTINEVDAVYPDIQSNTILKEERDGSDEGLSINVSGPKLPEEPIQTDSKGVDKPASDSHGVIELKPRIFVVGDIHGDFEGARDILFRGNVTNKDGDWIGGSHTTLIQTGDVLDRGDGTIKLYSWFIKLRDQAASAGGLFIPLLGNHELLNLKEKYKDVSKEEIATFGSVEHRKFEFSRDGWIGQYLRGLDITATVDGTLFVHGGVAEGKYEVAMTQLNEFSRNYLQSDSVKKLKKRILYKQDFDGPLWYRGYYFGDDKEKKDKKKKKKKKSKKHRSKRELSDDGDSELVNDPEFMESIDNDAICKNLQIALDTLKVKRMVMGHTITKTKRIETKCQGKAIFIDTMISHFMGNGHRSALEIVDNRARALYFDSDEVTSNEVDFFNPVEDQDLSQNEILNN